MLILFLSCEDFRLRKDVQSDIKEENISKNEGTVFNLYLGWEDEKEKMEWNDMKIVQSNHLTNQGKRWLASQSVGKFRSVTLKNSSRVDAESKCSCVDHKLSVNRIIKRQKVSVNNFFI
jgi:hypothetical protein